MWYFQKKMPIYIFAIVSILFMNCLAFWLCSNFLILHLKLCDFLRCMIYALQVLWNDFTNFFFIHAHSISKYFLNDVQNESEISIQFFPNHSKKYPWKKDLPIYFPLNFSLKSTFLSRQKFQCKKNYNFVGLYMHCIRMHQLCTDI